MKKHVEFESNGLILRGYLQMPDAVTGKVPLLCMFHGFTSNKMEDHFYYVRLSKRLETLGIASLRMDFGNSGESDGKFENMTPIVEIKDAINIVEYGKLIPNIDLDRIGLIGSSMGGMIAGIVASELKDDVKCLCLISPAANTEQIMSDYFENGNRIADINGLLFSRDAFDEMKTIDPYERSKGFIGDVLIVHGTKDEVVPNELSKKYKDIYGGKVNFVDIEGGNHILSCRKWEMDLSDAIIKFSTSEFSTSKF
ncbi:alpha/beta hydrolase [Clostridium sp.]|jgi:pimeloyl-ACP methyl ester carboxylesterase|uniref:alpha/beta hydrolase n=1 Tax=Clostridium sp. TaxID=1506 RepID=UPI003EE8E044